MDAAPLTGILLAGGASTRMGRDKALLEVEGMPLVHRVLGRLARVPGVDEVLVVAPRDHPVRRLRLGDVELVEDPGTGPRHALAAGLGAAAGNAAVVAPVDAPHYTPAVARRLTDALGDHDAVAARLDGHLHVLHGAYAPRAAAAFQGGGGSVLDALQHLDLHVVGEGTWASWPGARAHFVNVNTPEDLSRAVDN